MAIIEYTYIHTYVGLFCTKAAPIYPTPSTSDGVAEA